MGIKNIIIVSILSLFLCNNCYAALFAGAEVKEMKAQIEGFTNKSNAQSDMLKDIQANIAGMKTGVNDVKLGLQDNKTGFNDIQSKIAGNQTALTNNIDKVKTNIEGALAKVEANLNATMNNNIKMSAEMNANLSNKMRDMIANMQFDLRNNMKAELDNATIGQNNSVKNTTSSEAGRDVTNSSNESSTITNDPKMIISIISLVVTNFVSIIWALFRAVRRKDKELSNKTDEYELKIELLNKKFLDMTDAKNFYKSEMLSRLSYEESQAVLKKRELFKTINGQTYINESENLSKEQGEN